MSRKKHKKHSEQQKRFRVTDASGWTHIIKGSRGQNHLRYTNLHVDGKPSEPPKDLTVDKVLEKFQKYSQNWKDSVSFEDFQLILEEDVLASEKCKITQCVCLGLGSFTSEDGREASMHELAFLSTTLETLGRKHKIDDIYLQDPAFNHLDKEVIQSLGYTVLKTPEAFEKISTTTFLFVPHLEPQFYAMALDAAHPSLCIGNDLEVCGDIYPGDPNWMVAARRTFDRYMDTTVSRPMPLFDQDTWPYFMRIYWPRLSDDLSTKNLQPVPQQSPKDGNEISEKLNRLELEERNPATGHV